MLKHHFFSPSRIGEQTFCGFGVDNNVMSQRSDFAEFTFPLWSFEPRIFARLIERLPHSRRTSLRSGVFIFGNAHPRVKILAGVFGIFIPSVLDALGDNVGSFQIFGSDGSKDSLIKTHAEIFNDAI